MLELNYSNMMSEVIGDAGLKIEQITSLADKSAKAHAEIAQQRWAEMGFIDLLKQDTSEIKRIGKEVREYSDDFLALGIGGSALGPRTILEALSPMHNVLGCKPRVFIYDNVDPMTLSNILSTIDINRTTVNAITKSGSTAETMSSFMILYEKLRGTSGKVVATTDPDKGYQGRLPSLRV